MFELLPESEPTPVPLPQRRPFTVHACLRARTMFAEARIVEDFYRDGSLVTVHDFPDSNVISITMCADGETDGPPCRWRPRESDGHRLHGACVAEAVRIDLAAEQEYPVY